MHKMIIFESDKIKGNLFDLIKDRNFSEIKTEEKERRLSESGLDESYDEAIDVILFITCFLHY